MVGAWTVIVDMLLSGKCNVLALQTIVFVTAEVILVHKELLLCVMCWYLLMFQLQPI